MKALPPIPPPPPPPMRVVRDSPAAIGWLVMAVVLVMLVVLTDV